MVELFCDIQNGEIKPLHVKLYDETLRRLNGKRVRIIIKQSRRTIQQNALYWGVVIAGATQLLNDNGNSFEPETVHQIFKRKFLTKKIKFVNAQTAEIAEIQVVGSTTELTSAEFNVYIDKCVNLINDWFGVNLLQDAES